MSQLPPPPTGPPPSAPPPSYPQPTYYQPQPQWTPPKKSSAFGAGFKGCLGVLAAIVVGIIVIAVIISVGSKNNDSSKVGGSPAASSSSGGDVQTYKPGDTIKVGDNLLFTVTGVTSSKGSQFEKPSKGQYLIVAVAVQNNDTKANTVSSIASFELRDATGQSYNETILTTAPKPPDGEIAAHDKLAGALTYDVPTGTTYKLYFKNDLFSGGQVIVDLGAH